MPVFQLFINEVFLFQILEKSVHIFFRPSLSEHAIPLLTLQTLHSSQSFTKSGL